MAIEKKHIHFGKLADFEAQLTAGNILDRSIVFIQDAKKIWTHGTYYDCSEGTATGDIVQSDWNENDPVSDSYIQGRTHFSYDVEQIALFSIASKNEGDILVTGLYDGGFYKLYNQAGGKSESFHFVEGRKVPIPSVGPTIEAVCTYEDDYCLKLTTPTYGMNESFSLREMYVEQLKDIYVPETIARTSELKTINGESILGEGDLTVEGGAKVYTWNWDGSESGTLTQDEYDGIVGADIVYVAVTGGIPTQATMNKDGDYRRILISQFVPQANGTIIVVSLDVEINEDKSYNSNTSFAAIPTKTSQLENDSNFVTSDGLKTINGESILGSGDITISGGSSGGSGAYSEVNHGTSDTTFALTPNTFHIWDEVANLTLTLGSETSGVANEFLFQFTSGATATTLSLPSDLKWANDTPPTIAENMIYQISILKGMASVLEFSNNNSVMPITLYAVNSSTGSSHTNPPSDNPNANKLYEELMSLSNNTGQGNLDVGLVTLVVKDPGIAGTGQSYNITSYSLAPSYISEGILLLKQGYGYYVLQQDGTIQSIFYD